MIATLSNSEQLIVVFLDVILRKVSMSSSTARKRRNMLKEKFMNMSEVQRRMLVFPATFEKLTEASKGSRILIPLLSIVNPSTFPVISMVSPFKTILEQPLDILQEYQIFHQRRKDGATNQQSQGQSYFPLEMS